ncbi:aldo/keto reductase [Pelagicoccus mobilis]|uniref:Aldo/keto reductase n=1 Tax=Pelagicoccus mobilis TaxID=415221 RepID=A0A934VQ42_9BACT|nr:aldo/keto reductase [Pelagicoccus mobilis]MBK1876500.1 aldo/keto reductase [Pelagicoccus mobilis]
MYRRKFVKAVGSGLALGTVASRLSFAKASPSSSHIAIGTQAKPTLALDGLMIAHGDRCKTAGLLQAAYDHGIRYIDTSMTHIAGRSERRIGRFLENRKRDQFFVQSRLKVRRKEVATSELELSLARLRTDYLDAFLLDTEVRNKIDDQFEIPDENTFEALIEAKEAGKIRKIGLRGFEESEQLDRLLKLYGEHVEIVMIPFGMGDDTKLMRQAQRYGFDLIAEGDRKLQQQIFTDKAGVDQLPKGLSSWVVSFTDPKTFKDIIGRFDELAGGAA